MGKDPVGPAAVAPTALPAPAPATVPGKSVGGANQKREDLIVPSVADFVRRMGGTHAISRILIANNGIAAVKAIRDMRRFAYLTFGDASVSLFFLF